MHRLFRCTYALLILALTAGPACAQVQTGTPPFGSFGGGPDIINLGNLNAHIAVPVLHKSGRGTNFTYDLSYDTSVWYPVTSAGTTSWTSTYNWGWRAQTEVATGYVNAKFTEIRRCLDQNRNVIGYAIQYSNYTYHDPFGVGHVFSGTLIIVSGTCGSGTNGFTNTASDGSGYTFSVNQVNSYALTNSLGTKINAPWTVGTGAGSFTDRNGNELTVDGSGHFYDTLSSAVPVLTVAGSGTQTSPQTFSYAAPSTGTATYTMSFKTYTVKTNFGCSGVADYGPTSNSLVDRITLPDGTFYQFNYEASPGFTGDVTGRLASVTLPTLGTISYTYTGGSSGNITCADGSTAGLTRSVSTDGGNWTYTRTAGTGAAYTTAVTDPQGDKTQIQFQGIYETQRQVNQGASTLLQTTNTCYNASASPCTATAITLPISQVDVYVQPAGASNLVAKHTTKYNVTYGMVTETDDYDYSATPPGALLQKTAITYASLTNNIVAFQQQVTVTNGTGTTISQTNNNYDETAVTTTSGTPQHTSISGSRGNLTSVNSYSNGTAFLTSRSTYFDTGNAQTVTDVNGAQTTYTYGNCGNSFPTNVAEPLSMSRSFAWNCTGGVMTQVTDENNHATSIIYNDSQFWRPAEEDFPDGGKTTWTYGLNPSSVTTRQTMNSSQTIVSAVVLDGLGRPDETQMISDPQGPGYTVTTYDSLGRIGSVYNPTRCNAPTTNCGEGTWGKTTLGYDALGRTTSVTDPDNSVASASFTNNTVMVMDEAGKKRQIQSDALGRTTQVTEDPGGLGYVTTYGYAALSNPTSVTSGSNQRTYAYDELGRLTSEINPETGGVTYAYNSNGDLSTRTDAHAIVTTYGFDVLHRITGKTYSDGTPQVVYGYDINNPFFQTATNTVGRLVQIWTGSNPQFATWTAFSYDSMGRATTQWNCLSFPWANTCPNIVTTKMQYDLAGDVTQMTYPSGMVVQQSFDSAGRLCQVAGATSICSSPINPWATAFTYDPASQVTAFNYGNGVAATFGYTNRLQRNSLKYAKGSTTLFNLNYAFGSAGSNNGSISGITDAVDNGRSVTYGYDPLNRLSSALTTGSTNYPQWGLSWTYDRYGNRTAQTVTAGTAPGNSVSVSATTNRITTSGYGYDASGNMTNDGNNALGYDGEGRVITASGSFGSGSYNYGGDSLRAHQVSGTAAINSIYLGSSVIGQYDNESGVLGEFIYAGGQQLATTGGVSIANGGFEQGLSGWTTQGSTVQVITDSSRAHSGSNYVQVSTSSVTASVTAPTFAVLPGDVVDFGGWVYLESGGGAAVDWVLYAFDASHTLIAAVVPTPWSVTTPGAWTYETGSYTVPSNIAYVTLLCQVYQPSGATTARFDDGFLIAGTHYFHPDHLSTRVLTSANGTVLGQQGHYPFGESWYAQNGTTNWQFTSYQRDSESRNDYALMRSYVNRLARFSSPDPAGLAAASASFPQTWNRYAYVLNNPLALVDPSGLICDGANGVGMGVGGNPANGTGILTPEACALSGGTWIDPVYTQVTVTSGPNDPAPGGLSGDLLGPDLHGLLTDSSGGGGTSARIQCATKFGQDHSLAAGVGAVFGDKVGNNFVTQLLLGNTASSLAKIGTDLFDGTAPTGRQVAGMYLKGAGQGIPNLPGGFPVRGVAGTVRGAGIQAVVGVGYNVLAGVGQETLELGVSAGRIATVATPLASATLQGVASAVAIGKLVLDLGTFTYGAVVACRP